MHGTHAKGLLRATALALALGVGPGAAVPARDDLASLLAEARRAATAGDCEAQREALTRAERQDGLPSQRALVQALLAGLEWRLDGNTSAARARLERATARPAPFAAWRELARMETACGEYPAARTAARAAVRASESAEERLEARLAFATAAVEEASALRLAGEEGAIQDLRQAFRDVRALVARGTGGRDAARLLIRAAVVLREGEPVLEGLRAYFEEEPGGSGWNRIAAARAELERMLPTWRGAHARAEPALIRALADTRLFVEAALVAHDPRAPRELLADPEVAPILAYERYLRDVRALANESFRLRAIGEAERGSTKRDFERRTALLDAELRDRPGAPRVYGFAMLVRLEERFGLWVWTGSRSGRFDLHVGHCIGETEDPGHGAGLVVLDSMVAAGFRAWCGTPGGDPIGWTANGMTVHVR